MAKKRQKISLKVGDNVKVIAGEEKGKTGVIRAILRSAQTVIVDGINIKIKHVKPKRTGETGSIIQFESPIHISNVTKN